MDEFHTSGVAENALTKDSKSIERQGNNISVPIGEWVEVPKGMIVAPNTYVDAHGVMRSSVDHSCVVWHNKGCERRGIHASEIVYDPATSAPWCPTCWEKNRIAKVFRGGQ